MTCHLRTTNLNILLKNFYLIYKKIKTKILTINLILNPYFLKIKLKTLLSELKKIHFIMTRFNLKYISLSLLLFTSNYL